MISIIENGKEKTYYARCNKCGSEMEYMHADVKYETSMAYPQAKERYISCPVCGELIQVNLMTEEEFKEMKKQTYSFGYNSCCC